MRFEQMVGDLDQCHVRCSLDQGKNLRSMALNPGRTPVSALHTRLTGACASPLADQFDRCRRRHPEPAGRASTAHPLNFHSPNDAKTKIRREGLGHAGWPPLPAPMMNHDLPRKGIPSDSVGSENALAAQLSRLASLSVASSTAPFPYACATVRQRREYALAAWRV